MTVGWVDKSALLIRTSPPGERAERYQYREPKMQEDIGLHDRGDVPRPLLGISTHPSFSLMELIGGE